MAGQIIAVLADFEKMIKRKVRLKITTASRQSMRLSGHGLNVRCPECEREVETLSEGEAAGILQVDVAALDQLIASDRVHAIQTVSGNQRVCKDSLFDRRVD
jgi:hypothetical protein